MAPAKVYIFSRKRLVIQAVDQKMLGLVDTIKLPVDARDQPAVVQPTGFRRLRGGPRRGREHQHRAPGPKAIRMTRSLATTSFPRPKWSKCAFAARYRFERSDGDAAPRSTIICVSKPMARASTDAGRTIAAGKVPSGMQVEQFARGAGVCGPLPYRAGPVALKPL